MFPHKSQFSEIACKELSHYKDEKQRIDDTDSLHIVASEKTTTILDRSYNDSVMNFDDFAVIFDDFAAIFDDFAAIFDNFAAIFDDFVAIFDYSVYITII